MLSSKPFLCRFKASSHRSSGSGDNDNEKPLVVITPTYRRPEQIAELTRMAQTLSLAAAAGASEDGEGGEIHWMLVEDDSTCNDRVKKLLNRFFGLSSRDR